ncbi:hypothetical protein CHU92_03165 [Flavobacterium cyanobacteriorum]|uniref:Uncharacterized protein n=1 Tax=Flavobacterium cyanobacteriorum TaxID=2022802 RepID=A0A255ZSE1_9FLAO|nr:hypothetical protein [Flavobacterium cyanobacteriorum]OYQ43640.1 hypothetical protein CHU92_03165 [Flavobacterium cyanobacteriorum]
MKKTLIALLLLWICIPGRAQGDCKFTTVSNTEGNEYKSTAEYLMYEKVFAGSSAFVFFSLSVTEGIPVLNFQLLHKSQDFPKAYCLDKASRIYLQLTNGKIITLISVGQEQCASLMYDSESKSNMRILSGMFLFGKGSMEELEKYPVTLMRVKYSTETVDYTIRKEIQSETVSGKFFPENYFVNYLKCIK